MFSYWALENESDSCSKIFFGKLEDENDKKKQEEISLKMMMQDFCFNPKEKLRKYQDFFNGIPKMNIKDFF